MRVSNCEALIEKILVFWISGRLLDWRWSLARVCPGGGYFVVVG